MQQEKLLMKLGITQHTVNFEEASKSIKKSKQILAVFNYIYRSNNYYIVPLHI